MSLPLSLHPTAEALRADIAAFASGAPLPLKPLTSAARLFVSSTFVDHDKTRTVLRERVFPQLTRWCAERGLQFLSCDLNWGVPREHNSLDACFSALRECEVANGAPFFLYLGAQRLGWQPLAEDLAAFSRPGAAALHWVPGASVTAMEVLAGALRPRNPRALFCLRDQRYLDSTEARGEAGRSPGKSWDELCGQPSPLEPLIEEHARALGTPDCILRFCPLTERGWEEFAEAVAGRLRDLLQSALPPASESAGTEDEEAARHAQHAQLLAEASLPAPTTEGLLGMCAAGGGRTLLLVAPSGGGKTTVMAQVAEQLRVRSCRRLVHFCGPLPGSTDTSALEDKLAQAICDFRGITLPVLAEQVPPTEDTALGPKPDKQASSKQLTGLLAALAPRPEHPADVECGVGKDEQDYLVVLVDAVNQLETGNAQLQWLNSRPTPDILLVVSCTPEYYDGKKQNFASTTVVHLQPLDNIELARSALGRYSKTLLEPQLYKLVGRAQNPTPLWIKLAVDVVLAEATFEKLDGVLSSLEPTVTQLLERLFKGAEAAIARAQGSNEDALAIHARVGLLAVCCLVSSGSLTEEGARASLSSEVGKQICGIDDSLSDWEWAELRGALTFLWQPYASERAVIRLGHVQLEEAVRNLYDYLIPAAYASVVELGDRLNTLQVFRNFAETRGDFAPPVYYFKSLRDRVYSASSTRACIGNKTLFTLQFGRTFFFSVWPPSAITSLLLSFRKHYGTEAAILLARTLHARYNFYNSDTPHNLAFNFEEVCDSLLLPEFTLEPAPPSNRYWEPQSTGSTHGTHILGKTRFNDTYSMAQAKQLMLARIFLNRIRSGSLMGYIYIGLTSIAPLLDALPFLPPSYFVAFLVLFPILCPLYLLTSLFSTCDLPDPSKKRPIKCYTFVPRLFFFFLKVCHNCIFPKHILLPFNGKWYGRGYPPSCLMHWMMARELTEKLNYHFQCQWQQNMRWWYTFFKFVLFFSLLFIPICLLTIVRGLTSLLLIHLANLFIPRLSAELADIEFKLNKKFWLPTNAVNASGTKNPLLSASARQ